MDVRAKRSTASFVERVLSGESNGIAVMLIPNGPPIVNAQASGGGLLLCFCCAWNTASST